MRLDACLVHTPPWTSSPPSQTLRKLVSQVRVALTELSQSSVSDAAQQDEALVPLFTSTRRGGDRGALERGDDGRRGVCPCRSSVGVPCVRACVRVVV